MKPTTTEVSPDEKAEAVQIFAQTLGLTEIESAVEKIGPEEFLKFQVGRRAPVYENALRETSNRLGEDHPFRGLLGLSVSGKRTFPDSMEATILRGLLTRSTRPIAGQPTAGAFSNQFVPFQNNEETEAIQPATHLIVGRRGVGKTTLILKAQELLTKSRNIPVLVDMQPYTSNESTVVADVLADLAKEIGLAIISKRADLLEAKAALDHFSEEVLNGRITASRASAAFRRVISSATAAADADLFVFLDDFHLVHGDLQATVAETVHGALKGARGWLKIAGLRSLLRVYDPTTKRGLQSPGDAQVISLDLTLVDPEAAESHLRKILASFLHLVGVDKLGAAIAERAFHRLVWANAGVPRDFLQMIAKSLEHARRGGRKRIEISDANLAIGEFGQQKLTELEKDAKNEKGALRKTLAYIEEYCLEKQKKKVNAFLIRSDSSEEFRAVQTLSDLRLLHLLHQTITPHKAGERYVAYMLDYSLFTGFRQRRNITQMLPDDGKQFKAKQLRKIPILPSKFLSDGSGSL